MKWTLKVNYQNLYLSGTLSFKMFYCGRWRRLANLIHIPCKGLQHHMRHHLLYFYFLKRWMSCSNSCRKNLAPGVLKSGIMVSSSVIFPLPPTNVAHNLVREAALLNLDSCTVLGRTFCPFAPAAMPLRCEVVLCCQRSHGDLFTSFSEAIE